jgi:Fe-S-cluster containining protein
MDEPAWERLRDEVARGLEYTHHRANTNTGKVLEVASFAYAAIELLVEQGVLTVDDVDQRKKAVADRLVEKFCDDGMGVVRTEPEIDKYAFDGGVEIDCENRIPICRAACCRLSFALSRQDVEEGVVQWDFARPYMIAQGEDGYCAHLDRTSRRCGVYEHRPVACRGYDCRRDSRIWADFENRVPSPDLERLFEERPLLQVRPFRSRNGTRAEGEGQDRGASTEPGGRVDAG